MSRPSRRRAARRLAAVLVAMASAWLVAAPASFAHGGGRTPLRGTVPSFARTKATLGHAPATQQVLALVDLRQRHRAALNRLVRRVSHPSSPDYGHYLTPARFRARFAPKPRAAIAVERFARRSGFRIAAVPKNRHYVAIAGTVSQAEAAFRTRLESFRVEGRLIHAPVSTPTIPSSLRRYVTQVSGLNTADRARPLTSGPNASPPPAFVGARPCSSYFGKRKATTAPLAYGKRRPWVVCGYTPSQIQSAYGFAPALANGLDGRGQTVAVVDAYDSPTIAKDVNIYSNRHGLPFAHVTRRASTLATNTPEIPGTFVDPQGWAVEETLDIEAVHSMAPRAQLVYEGADSPLDISLSMALNDVVDNARAQIVSNSYGDVGDFDNSSDTDPIFKQAAVEGIGIYFASGDEGDETKDPNGPGDREVDAPANDPLVTAVGGTSLAVKQSGGYGFETYWGTSKSTLMRGAWRPKPPGTYLYGGGGGTSQTYAEPSWQKGIVPASIASYWKGKPPEAFAGDASGRVHVPGRAVPDVSMDGDPNTGFRVGITQDFSSPALGLPFDDYHYGEYRIGGTSLSSPLFAGVMALADQAAGLPHGFANPALYAAFRKRAYRDVRKPRATRAEVRRDYKNSLDSSGGVTTSLRTFNRLNTLHLLTGYDDATGLGSPKGLTFLHALAPGSVLVNRLIAARR